VQHPVARIVGDEGHLDRLARLTSTVSRQIAPSTATSFRVSMWKAWLCRCPGCHQAVSSSRTNTQVLPLEDEAKR
jgi:hypothetical protein